MILNDYPGGTKMILCEPELARMILEDDPGGAKRSHEEQR